MTDLIEACMCCVLVKLFFFGIYIGYCPFDANEFIDESAVECFMKLVSITRRIN